MFAKFMQTAAAVAILATPALAAPDTITLAMVLEPPNLDPTGGAAAAIDEIVYANLFEGLTRIASDGSVQVTTAVEVDTVFLSLIGIRTVQGHGSATAQLFG